MPNTKSAIKAMRQNLRRRKINLTILNKIKQAGKQVRKLALDGKASEAKQALNQAYSTLDKAAKKRVIHKNKASRLKARLTKLVEKKSA